MTARAEIVEHRVEGNAAALVFVHGFATSGLPFGRFAELLAAEPALAGWDILGVGYSTGLMPDLRRAWATDPSIDLLAGYLRSRARLGPLDRYDGLAVVAHSMGGLVVQSALLDDPELADRVSHVFLFGTPSAGVRIARWGGFLKRQISDMAEGGPFITRLRDRWDGVYSERRPFDLWVVAGDRDSFVPAHSSLGPFPPETHLVVPGDHLEIVEVPATGSMSVQVVAEGLQHAAAPAGPLNSARAAVASSEHDRAIRILGDDPSALDEAHLVDLALALHATGRADEAIAVLTEHAGPAGTDAQGTLAGQLKRRWLDSGHRRDAEAALELYAGALAAAGGAGDDEQAYYHAINVAFLEVAFRRDRGAATAAAREALAACGRSPVSYWRLATEAEAHLQIGDHDRALGAYRDAAALEPSPRDSGSAYVQARQLCEVLGRRDLLDGIDAAFGPPGSVP